MTHRERVVAALSHEQPDMVPIDLGGTVNSSIVVEGYEKLKEYFGIEAESQIVQRMTRIVDVDERILSSLDIDTRAVFTGTPVIEDLQDTGPKYYRDQWGVERVKPAHSFYYDQVNFPLAGNITASDVVKYPWPDPEDPALTQKLKERVAWIRENTDYAVILRVPSPFVHTSQYLRGFEDWYCDLALNTSTLEMLFDAQRHRLGHRRPAGGKPTVKHNGITILPLVNVVYNRIPVAGLIAGIELIAINNKLYVRPVLLTEN